ncbi:hypothetical protein B0H13DRAFT_1972234 [Mycena leptocephala]|nr:hypothetical protein B0H13DRAFT_1972234 [Mycena leptocephala]
MSASPPSAALTETSPPSTKILIYQNLISYLREACSSQGRPPSEVAEVQRTLDSYMVSMSSDGVVASIVRSMECRKVLFELSSKLGLSGGPDFHQAFRADEERIAALLVSIFESESAKKLVLSLDSDEAQWFLDVSQEALDRGFLMAPEHSRQARRLIRKLSESCDKLPSSLFITGVSGREESPMFGGGFTDVYRAVYGGQTVALKHMRAFAGLRGADLRRYRVKFCREALIWQQLHHRHILTFIGIDGDSFSPSLCMVCPWMEHGTILKYIRDHGHEKLDELLFQVAQGLEYLHSGNIVHGDLRGANILIDQDQSARIADFGLSVSLDKWSADESSILGGSMRWMAPELLDPTPAERRFERTRASDIYAFGCVCLELYTGRPPFPELSDVNAMLKVIHGERPGRPTGTATMSDALWWVVQQCWAQDSADRPDTRMVVAYMRSEAYKFQGLHKIEIDSDSTNSQPADHVILDLKDINEQYITLSLPLEVCQSWPTFCDWLTRQEIQALSYVQAKQFVVRLEDNSKLLYDEAWTEWISSSNYRSDPHPRLTLCIVRNFCCDKPTENDNGFCNNCQVQILEDNSPLYNPQSHSSGLSMSSIAQTSMLAEEPLTSIGSPRISGDKSVEENQIEQDDKHIQLSTIITLPADFPQIIPSAHNSVVRRRRRPPSQEETNVYDTPAGLEDLHPPSSGSHEADKLDGTGKLTSASQWLTTQGTQFMSKILLFLNVAYIFMIAPPFVHDDDTFWDNDRLENRVNALQGWVLGATTGISAAAAALLALSNVSSSPIPQSFLILSGIFSMFGCFYTIFLAFHIGDHKRQFSNWFLVCDLGFIYHLLTNLRQNHPDLISRNRSFWSPSIMISLPITWMAWAVVNLVCFLVSLGIQIFMFDLDGTESLFPNSDTPKSITTTLSIFQLAVFTLVVVWSLVYVVMVHFELKNCRASRNHQTAQLETGIELQDIS